MPTPAKLFVKPAPGLMIRDPASKLHLPPHGKAVADVQFWQRRLADKDCVVTTAEEIEAGDVAAAAKAEADAAAAS